MMKTNMSTPKMQYPFLKSTGLKKKKQFISRMNYNTVMITGRKGMSGFMYCNEKANTWRHLADIDILLLFFVFLFETYDLSLKPAKATSQEGAYLKIYLICVMQTNYSMTPVYVQPARHLMF
jgi:hypothetical protein